MLRGKACGRQSVIVAALGIFMLFATGIQIATAADSGCVTCHLDQEMLKKTVKVEKGKKSAMQSGAG